MKSFLFFSCFISFFSFIHTADQLALRGEKRRATDEAQGALVPKQARLYFDLDLAKKRALFTEAVLTLKPRTAYPLSRFFAIRNQPEIWKKAVETGDGCALLLTHNCCVPFPQTPALQRELLTALVAANDVDLFRFVAVRHFFRELSREDCFDILKSAIDATDTLKKKRHLLRFRPSFVELLLRLDALPQLTAEEIAKEEVDAEEVDEAKDQCSICLTNCSFITSAIPRCGHTFHRRCLMTWIATQPTCPLCRTHTVRKHCF